MDSNNQKLALIVDDSKLARVTLRKLLEKYELDVDTAHSAEEALEYLCKCRPSVIFMDHMMPGMDGFQAVKAIKNDPNTATIPIVMYTSKGGSVYVGQARALGAFDVLSKETKSTKLFGLLERLHLLPEAETASQATSEPAQDSAETQDEPANKPAIRKTDFSWKKDNPAISQTSNSPISSVIQSDHQKDDDKDNTPFDVRNIKYQINRLLEENRSAIHRDVSEICEHNLNKVSNSIQNLYSEINKERSEMSEERQATEFVTNKKRSTISLFIIFLVGVSLFWFYTIYMEAYDKNIALAHENTDLVAEKEKYINLASGENKQLLNTLSSQANKINAQGSLFLESLEWAMNIKGSFNFGQVALDDYRLDIIRGLVSRLSSSDFKGTVHVDVHFGEFCLVRNSQNEYMLPDKSVLLTACDVNANAQDLSVSMGSQQSLTFAYYISSSPLLKKGAIKIKPQSHGIDEPLYEYPYANTIQYAWEWNKVAQLNNRIEISIISDEL